MNAAVDLFRDQYERKARVTPGLLVALPILVPLVCVYGPKHPVLTAVVALLGGCGAIYALASIARGRGKRLEERLLKSWGGMPTTLLLRHGDGSLDGVTKARYHDLIRTNLGIQMPTRDEEASDPFKADEAYIGAAKRLRELTRGEKGLLLKENIAYGFHRNMLAMKPVGILTSMIGLLYGLALAKVLQIKKPYLDLTQLQTLDLASGLTCAISLGLLAAWLFYFDEGSVRRIGFAYADRLFESLTTIRTSTARNLE